MRQQCYENQQPRERVPNVARSMSLGLRHMLHEFCSVQLKKTLHEKEA